MQNVNIHQFFNRVTFQKTTSEIKTKAQTKVAQIKSKITEREQRIHRLREEYKITDAVLIDLLTQARNDLVQGALKMFYNSTVSSAQGSDQTQNVTIGAGVVTNILTEKDAMAAEEIQVTRLELVIRNISDVMRITSNGMSYVEPHTLSFEEMTFLGF